MEDREIKHSPGRDEVINVSYKMFLFLCLAMFSPVATDIKNEIAQRIAKIELFVEYNDSHPHFKECVKAKTTVQMKKFRTLSFYSLLKSYQFWKYGQNSTIIQHYHSIQTASLKNLKNISFKSGILYYLHWKPNSFCSVS